MSRKSAFGVNVSIMAAVQTLGDSDLPDKCGTKTGAHDPPEFNNNT
jgi:hypothetical protein